MAELEAARAAVAGAEAARGAAAASRDTGRAQLAQLEAQLLEARCGTGFSSIPLAPRARHAPMVECPAWTLRASRHRGRMCGRARDHSHRSCKAGVATARGSSRACLGPCTFHTLPYRTLSIALRRRVWCRHAYADAEAASAAAREASEAAAAEQARLQGELAAARAQLEAAAREPERADAQTAALLQQLQARRARPCARSVCTAWSPACQVLRAGRWQARAGHAVKKHFLPACGVAPASAAHLAPHALCSQVLRAGRAQEAHEALYEIACGAETAQRAVHAGLGGDAGPAGLGSPGQVPGRLAPAAPASTLALMTAVSIMK